MTIGPDFNTSDRDWNSHPGRCFHSDFQYPKSQRKRDFRAAKGSRDRDRDAERKDFRCTIAVYGLIFFSFSCALASCSSGL